MRTKNCLGFDIRQLVSFLEQSGRRLLTLLVCIHLYKYCTGALFLRTIHHQRQEQRVHACRRQGHPSEQG